MVVLFVIYLFPVLPQNSPERAKSKITASTINCVQHNLVN